MTTWSNFYKGGNLERNYYSKPIEVAAYSWRKRPPLPHFIGQFWKGVDLDSGSTADCLAERHSRVDLRDLQQAWTQHQWQLQSFYVNASGLVSVVIAAETTTTFSDSSSIWLRGSEVGPEAGVKETFSSLFFVEESPVHPLRTYLSEQKTISTN
ncbi:unnamed protein product [Soboliphyme baturini]|uniref:DUF3598 domain-containing protein n=1 Tax=Soboliphyme baturini TaxID=241478 RepID=A0A183IAV7_9BILA|nr:unnamed protein product [Soboliphyme baturini]